MTERSYVTLACSNTHSVCVRVLQVFGHVLAHLFRFLIPLANCSHMPCWVDHVGSCRERSRCRQEHAQQGRGVCVCIGVCVRSCTCVLLLVMIYWCEGRCRITFCGHDCLAQHVCLHVYVCLHTCVVDLTSSDVLMNARMARQDTFVHVTSG